MYSKKILLTTVFEIDWGEIKTVRSYCIILVKIQGSEPWIDSADYEGWKADTGILCEQGSRRPSD